MQSAETPKRIGRPRIDITGQRFGKRVVLGPVPVAKNKHARWSVRCDCGHQFTCLTQDLRRGKPCMRCGHKGPRPTRRLRPFEALYNIFVGRAKHPVQLTYEQFAQLAKITECHYCGAEIFWQEYRHRSNKGHGSNLDRCDSAGPYSAENVVVCCGRCNYAKNNHFTYDEWRALGAVIRSWR